MTITRVDVNNSSIQLKEKKFGNENEPWPVTLAFTIRMPMLHLIVHIRNNVPNVQIQITSKTLLRLQRLERNSMSSASPL